MASPSNPTDSISQHTGIIAVFSQHRVAANMLMIALILIGCWALTKLNTQFFPNFELDLITVRTVWSGAAAEDIESGITTPLEQELRTLDNVSKITSTSASGVSAITIEFNENTNMDSALESVNNTVRRFRQFPNTAEDPIVNRITRYERIARFLVTGPDNIIELKTLSYSMKDALLARGISKIDITGLPKEEIAIQVPMAQMLNLGIPLEDIGRQIQKQSQDVPSGSVGNNDISRQLRALNKRKTVIDFEQLPLTTRDKKIIQLGAIANIQRRTQPDQTLLFYNNRPAVELKLSRDEAMDSLLSAKILNSWLEEIRPTLPPSIKIHVFDEKWLHIKERINLLLTNGGGGLILVVTILLLFLNKRVAFWVTVGIPVSFLATLFALYLTGGSINMISLFGLIMALGIIVDDAIVVGEDTLTQYENGQTPINAAILGAKRVFIPVMASSLTTIAAFLPLMLVSGRIGNILVEIPIVIICVIIASLIECFLILPGHLRASLENKNNKPLPENKGFKSRFENQFIHFKNNIFKDFITKIINKPQITVATAIAMLIICIGLIVGGRVGFTLFPNIDGRMIFATVSFTAGHPANRIKEFIKKLEIALSETEKELGGDIVNTAVTRLGLAQGSGGLGTRQGEQHGSIMVELTSPDQRTLRNTEFINHWLSKVKPPPGVELFTITEKRAGHPGRDIDLRLTGLNSDTLKNASIKVIEALKTMPGISGIEDDLPWGSEQYVFQLSTVGKALGLTTDSVGRQLRTAFDGYLIQLFQDKQDEVEVKIMLPDSERNNLASIDSMNILLQDGRFIPLDTVVDISTRRGFEALRHTNGQLAVSISADVDRSVNNNNRIRTALQTNILGPLQTSDGVTSTFQGRAMDQRATLTDMAYGALVGLCLIYIILTWTFSSYMKPLVIMAAIPFGLVGAIIGHLVMNIELTILSLFGFFGLSGIVVNDSIILVNFYQRLLTKGMEIREAIIEAACQRLRAVILTSLTTIAGLTPLLFETSLQAKFLIPMAATITFGLAFATAIVLMVVPSLLMLSEKITHYFSNQPADLDGNSSSNNDQSQATVNSLPN